MPKRSMLAVVAACATALAAAVPASAATTWTQVPSGTTAEITAIDYQSDVRAWFTTSDGRIFRADGAGGFVLEATVAGAVFADVAFQPGGLVGVAVTTDGQVQRSIDGGDNWAPVPLTLTYRSCSDATPTAVRRLSAVFWADASTVYYVGGGTSNQPIVLRGSEPIVSPRDVNTIAPGGGCRVGEGTNTVTDGYAMPSAPGTLRFIINDFGAVFSSSDALASPAGAFASMTIGTGGVPRLAVDPANPNRLWVTNSEGGGLTYAAAGPAREPVRRADTGLPVVGALHDVDFAGGTVVAVGDGGDLWTSVDGVTAHRQPAPGALAGTAWRAVGLADGGSALAGGAGGALVKTTNANSLPGTPPPSGPGPGGPPSGGPPRTPPRRTTGGRRGGGDTPGNATRPATTTTGGATVTTWRQVALSKGRYVPVRISAKSPRRFVIEIRRAKRPRTRIAMAKARLKKGKKLVKVPLRRSTKTGKYLIVVRVYKGRRAIGKRVRTAFVIVR